MRIPNFSFGGIVEPHEWVHKLQTAFRRTRVRDEHEKIDIALQHLEGPAHTWATRWECKNCTLETTFKEFKRDFLERIDGNNWVPFNVQLANLRQREMTVEDYTEKFQILESKCSLPIEEIRTFYIHNLRQEISSDVQMWAPKTLDKAYILARQAEEKINYLKKRLTPIPKKPPHMEFNRRPIRNGEPTQGS